MWQSEDDRKNLLKWHKMVPASALMT